MHSFVVLDDSEGKIRSIDFDFIGLLMSSMDTEEKLMKYDGNFPITPDEQDIEDGGNSGFFIFLTFLSSNCGALRKQNTLFT